MKTAELREKSVDELNNIIMDNRKELLNLRMAQGQTQGVKSSTVRQSRQTIARAKTLITEKQSAGDAS